MQAFAVGGINLIAAFALLSPVAPAWGQDLPAGLDKLIDKQKTGGKQEKTADGKPKMGLKEPACNNEECQKLWNEIRDVLEIWYAQQASPSSSNSDIAKLKDAMGVTHAEYGEVQTKKAKLKKSDPDKFGDKNKTEKHLKALTDKYAKCQKPCPQEAAKANRQEDCIIVLQYNETEKSVETAIANNTAVNEDFLGGAHALAAKLELDPKKIKIVGPKGDLISAIESYASDGICCKSLSIFGHGTPLSGALMLPYTMSDGPVGAPNNTLGGDVEMTHNAEARKEYAKKKLDQLRQAIKKNCPDPTQTVTFYSCFVGEKNGLAKQLSELGISTAGYSGSCTFPKDKDTNEYLLPEGKHGAEATKFPALGGGGGEFKKPERLRRREPGRPFGETISYVHTAIDSEKWCEYRDGVATQTALITTDQDGPSTEISEEATTVGVTTTQLETGSQETSAETQSQIDQSQAAVDQAQGADIGATVSERKVSEPASEDAPPDQSNETQPADTPKEKPGEEPATPTVSDPSSPSTPATSEDSQQPAEPESSIPDTIFVKAKTAVLEGTETGSPLENQVVKLLPAEEPDLPGNDETKEANDTGFDKDPVECMTGADGACQMQVPVEDRPVYDLPSEEASGRSYRVDYDLLNNSGGVAETTGNQSESFKADNLDGAQVAYEEFQIGNRTFVRIIYKSPDGVEDDFDEKFTPIFAESYEEDYCRDKQPGPPLGMQPQSFAAINHELPEAHIRIELGLPAGAAP
jgi:hypothetical protein